MTEHLVYWAQALDNASPDHIVFRGKEVPPEDATTRQEAVSLVSSVIKAGRRVFDQRGVRLTVDGRRFVMEVLSTERDRAGRAAPLVCCGDYNAVDNDAVGASVAVGIDDFAKRIGRTIHVDHFDMMRQSFGALKKKTFTTSLLPVVGVALLALALLVYVLVSRLVSTGP